MLERVSKGTVVFFSVGGHGHVNSMLSVIRELQRRHYHVIILTAEELATAPRLRAQGFELDFVSAEFENNELRQAKSMQSMADNLKRGREASFNTMMDVYERLFERSTRLHDQIEEKIKSLKPSLILTDVVIAIPCLTTTAPCWVRSTSLYSGATHQLYDERCVYGLGLKIDEMTKERRKFTVDAWSKIRGRIREFCTSKGLPDWDSPLDMEPVSPHLNFYMGPKEICYDGIFNDLPKEWFRLEHTIDQPGAGEDKTRFPQLPKSLTDLPGKLIYFSMGTIATLQVELVNRILGILRKSPNKFIVSMGALHEQIKLYDNMWGNPFIDQKAVLPNVDLFISHGGHNSTIEALYYGVPGILVLPVFSDQPDVGQRIQDQGLGATLNPFHCGENELLDTIESLLANDQMKERMDAIGRRLKSIEYPKIAADKLEELMAKTKNSFEANLLV